MNTLAEVRDLFQQWKTAQTEAAKIREQLNDAIVRAKDAGYSFANIREATMDASRSGMGIATIQMILAKRNKFDEV